MLLRVRFPLILLLLTVLVGAFSLITHAARPGQAAPPAQVPAQVIVQVDAANLRQAPGTDAPIVGLAHYGDLLRIVACNRDCTWYQLDTAAWIAAFLVAPAESGQTPAPPVAPAATIPPSPTPAGDPPVPLVTAYLRTGPGYEYAQAGTAQAGEPLALAGRNAAGDWLLLADGRWIPTFLVDHSPAGLPVVTTGTPPAMAAPTPAPTATPEPAAGITYYVDCHAGDDARSGRSEGEAWRSLPRANQVELAPGDALLFKRGCDWKGPLVARGHGTAERPITFGAYGSGELPVIRDADNVNVQIWGTYLVVQELHATLTDVPNPVAKCDNQPVAWKVGFHFEAGSAHSMVRHSQATRLAVGIYFARESHHNRALYNVLTDNNVVWLLATHDTIGAMGILLHGDSQEVGYNYIANNQSRCTYTGVVESNGIELFAASNALIHHNTAYNIRVFSEMGSTPEFHSSNNTYAYNLHVTGDSSAAANGRFVVTRGWNAPFGPVLGTRLIHNTVYLTGAASRAVVCSRCGPKILAMQNNILWANPDPIWTDAKIVEANNLYWSSSGTPVLHWRNGALGPASSFADPQFVDPAKLNFNLRPTSPAVDKAAHLDDLQALRQPPAGGGPDIGAFEYDPAAPLSAVIEAPNTVSR